MRNYRQITIIIFAVIMAMPLCAKSKQTKTQKQKPALMWVDAEANFERFSSTDSIDYYMKKIKGLGFTHVVVDVRPITGEVLYESAIAPRMREWQGAERADFDYLGYFLKMGKKHGIKVLASMNVFCAGHNYFDRGIIYKEHPEWASVVYDPEKGIVPITQQKHLYGGMTNPANDEYQRYIIDVMKEIVTKYPTLDGLMLDRVRYDGIMADFSELSRKKFEEYIGANVESYPNDILSWQCVQRHVYKPVRGKLFQKWIEWRTKTITEFMAKAREEVKAANGKTQFCTYTGAWYPTYYEVGVNFASKDYDPSKDYDWATPNYKDYGYAELIDLYTTGNYYTDITKADYMKNKRSVKNETDSQSLQSEWYCVEGSCEKLRGIMGPNKFIGGILVDQFYDKPADLTRTIAENLKDSDGLMVFDIVHVIKKGLWKEVEAGMREGGQIR